MRRIPFQYKSFYELFRHFWRKTNFIKIIYKGSQKLKVISKSDFMSNLILVQLESYFSPSVKRKGNIHWRSPLGLVRQLLRKISKYFLDW